MIMATKEFTFDAAHRLEWNPGKCKQLHGHTYRLQVTVKGKINKKGIVMDFAELKSVVKNEIIDELDHAYLNTKIHNPTAENMAIWIWKKLETQIPVYEIKLWETPTSFVTYRG